METSDISQLAAILRENGDKVLNSISKFTLSANLLQNLNNSFPLIIEQRDTLNSTFHVINSSNTKVEVFRDLQFLHDFIQRTSSLKLTPYSFGKPFLEAVDISKFKNLTLLELQKINVSTVVGLQILRPQLQYLICIRSVNSLSDLLEKCGADASQAFIWSELKGVVLSHNNLNCLDSSLECVPWLHTVDLSHNNIQDASPLSCLSNLKYLNLSYNRLESVPVFTGQICSRLQVLVLGNNFIEDLRELSNLSNLCELDLSDNCLLEHIALVPLAYLATLQWLSLEGNPLSFHPQYRISTIRHLHLNTATVRFLLDRTQLSKTEVRFVGALQPANSLLQRSHLSSFCSTASESTVVAIDRPRRIRNATISDCAQVSEMDTSMASIASLVTSGEHLETKKQIEQLREQYGEKWLHSQGGSLFQDALGLQTTSLPITSTPYEKEFLLYADTNNVSFNKGDVVSEQSTNTFTTATESLASENSLYAGEQVGSPELPSDEGDDDLVEGEENLYLAKVKDESDDVFIVLTSTHLWERECTSTNERARWPLESLLSCDFVNSDPVFLRLQFDTVKRDRRERLYELEDEERTRLSNTLNDILSDRPLSKHKLVIYRCMKCSSQFSKDKNQEESDADTVACPACKSTLVIEDDEEK